VYLTTLGFLITGIVIQTLTVNYSMLAGGRITAALNHGEFWALVRPTAARMSPGNTGKAVSIVPLRSTIAMVVGSALATWLGGLIGWRPTDWVLGVLTIVAVAVLLPTVPSLPPLPKNDAAQTKHHMPWDLISLVLFLMLAVTGVFSAYTYLGL